MQNFNLGNALGQGMALGQQMQGIRRQNALADLFSQHGAGIASGDPQALNALAGIDPMKAFQIQRQRAADARAVEQHDFSMQDGRARLGMAQETHASGMKLDQARIQQIKAQSAAAARAEAAKMDAATVERERAELIGVISGLRQTIVSEDPQAYEAMKNQYAAQLAEAGVDPAALTFEDAPYMLANLVGVMEGLDAAADFGKGLGPQQDGFRAATPEEAALYGARAGQFDSESGRFYPINPPKEMRVESRPDGSFVVTDGAATGGDGRISPSDPAAMLSTIDGILNDPALESATGVRSVMQSVPGTDAYRFGTRVKQLEGQAFLQAFESLKGGGQITEVEGIKATQAIGRLDSAQSSKDYRDALKELRDILTAAQQRPQGWAFSPERQAETPSAEAREIDINGTTYRVQRVD